ncbi:MAG: RyR domain-containing protein [Candidatus Eremiobacteraeota bacterium]|nr:RyR domain-containing protein [Candidatus Eremiobacteraeota bacterium]
MSDFDEEYREWLGQEMRQYAALTADYERLRQVIHSKLESAVAKYASHAIVESRVKSLSSFAEKVARKKYKTPLSEITDLCGGRIIVFTREEVEIIEGFIRAVFAVDEKNSIDAGRRIRPSEFGYRSLHFVVTIPQGDLSADDARRGLDSLKCELQVRTAMEHAWAEFRHRNWYKQALPLPDRWEHELSALSALLETADGAFSRIQSGIKDIERGELLSTGSEKLRSELELFLMILDHDREDEHLAHRAGRLAMALEEWEKAVEIMKPFSEGGSRHILRDLGISLCKRYSPSSEPDKYGEGIALLEKAAIDVPCDTDGLTSLASALRPLDPGKAREFCRKAYEADPANPHVLGTFLTSEIASGGAGAPLAMFSPVIREALNKCLEQAGASLNLPWAYYDAALFHLFLGETVQSLQMYSRALVTTPSLWMVETTLKSLESLAGACDSLKECRSALRMLQCGMVNKSVQMLGRIGPGEAAPEDSSLIEKAKVLKGFQRRQYSNALPCFVIAGEASSQWTLFREALKSAFNALRALVLSGAEESTMLSFLSDLKKAYTDSLEIIPYSVLPQEKTATEGTIVPFLQYWTDILSSGYPPSEVKVLGVGASERTIAEYSVALAFGATVVLLEDETLSASSFLPDNFWHDRGTLYIVDAMTLEAFVREGMAPLEDEADINSLARAIHDSYRRSQLKIIAENDPSLKQWEELSETLKNSDSHQAAHIFEKMRTIGCRVEKKKAKMADFHFTEEELDLLAQKEHARWCVERIRDGWKYGAVKSVEKKITPWILGWSHLDEERKELDRKACLRIPSLLERAGLEICRGR